MIIRIADINVEIQTKSEYVRRYVKGFEAPLGALPDMTVTVSKEEIEEEKRRTLQMLSNFPDARREAYLGEDPDALGRLLDDGYIESICVYRRICEEMPRYDAFLLHGALVECRGVGVEFLGVSGAGKSTHSGLWLKYFDDVRAVNGDKPLVKYCGDKFVGYGTPWEGKERVGGNLSVPICAVCFIVQSKVNRIRKLSQDELSDRLFGQIHIPSDPECAMRIITLADAFVRSVDAYVLECDISREAAELSYNTIMKVKS